jgi:hypothetical protein
MEYFDAVVKKIQGLGERVEAPTQLRLHVGGNGGSGLSRLGKKALDCSREVFSDHGY